MIVLVKKIALGIVVFLIVALIATYGFFRHEIDQMLGGNTTVVDSSQFQYVSGKLAITNVSVLAEDSSVMLPNQTVLINGETISADI